MTSRRRDVLIVAACTVLGVVHALAIWPHYHVGSFDDDAAYIMGARGILHGVGLTGTLPAGYPLVGAYPPGFPALLAPIAWLSPHATTAFRILPLVGWALLFPLTWYWLSTRAVDRRIRIATLLLLALNPVGATFATMVMAESTFLILLLVLLLLVERWREMSRTFSAAGAWTVLVAAALIWVKEAGVGIVAGLVLWFVLARMWRKALTLGVGVGLLLLPLLIAREIVGTSLVGSRYAVEIAGTATDHYTLVHRVIHDVGAYLSKVIGRSILPAASSPIPSHGVLHVLGWLVVWLLPVLLVVGYVAWWRRHRDAAALAVLVYFLETLVYPFTNERRLVLVLPVILAWTALGAAVLLRAAARRWRGRVVPVTSGVVAAALLVDVLAQFPRDYLFALGGTSGRPEGSSYMALLQRLGPASARVETSYLWTTALFSGHPTVQGVYKGRCTDAATHRAAQADRARYLLSAAINVGGQIDSDCVLSVMSRASWAVRLYRTTFNDASVFQLVGPGLPGPMLSDALVGISPVAAQAVVSQQPEAAQGPGTSAGTYLEISPIGTSATVTWSWGDARSVHQVSVGAIGGALTDAALDLRRPDGRWSRVAERLAGHSAEPLLSTLTGTTATALRLTLSGPGPWDVHDVHVLVGP